jgi:hypothetical protein
MSSRQILNRLIIFAFMVLVGFALAMGIYYKSFIGIILALVALGAGINFLYLIAKAKKEMEEAEKMA